MDRSLPSSITNSRRRKRWIIALGIVAIIVVAVLGVRSFFHASIDRAAVQTGQVSSGDIENTLTAAGEVLPEFEEVIASPVSASILEVSIAAGATIQAGQPLLKLDRNAVESEYQKESSSWNKAGITSASCASSSTRATSTCKQATISNNSAYRHFRPMSKMPAGCTKPAAARGKAWSRQKPISA